MTLINVAGDLMCRSQKSRLFEPTLLADPTRKTQKGLRTELGGTKTLTSPRNNQNTAPKK